MENFSLFKLMKKFKILAVLMLGFNFNLIGQTTTITATGNGTWVCPPNVTMVTIEAWGAGGGGGFAISTNGAAGGGGGGGEYRIADIPVTPGQTYYYSVGSGGSRGTTGSGGVQATSGEITCFSTSPNCTNNLILANGGEAGEGVSTDISGNGGAGGTGGIGGTGYNGGNGANGINGAINNATYAGGGGGGGASTNGDGGSTTDRFGGSGATVGGGNGGNGSNNGNGGNGGNIGAGGAGGHRRSTNRNGGNGARGQLRIQTQVVNDECTNAIVLIPSLNTTCTNPEIGNSISATQSLPACTGNANDDVWYQFTATHPEHFVTVNPITMQNPVVQVYSNNCGSLSSIICRNAAGNNLSETVTLSDLTVGNTYFVRIYTFGATGQGTFEVCVTTIPIPENDECSNAIDVPVNSGRNCVNFVSGTTVGATQSIAAISCGNTGNANDDVWYKFTATSTSHTVTATSTSINDIVLDIRTGSCNGTNISCANTTTGGAPESVNLTNLTIGQEYFIRLYSFGGIAFRGSFNLCVTTPQNMVVSADNMYTVPQLVEEVLFENSCVSLSNINWRTGTNFGDANGIGYFYNNGSAFPFDNGIVLSTGGVNYATGPINEFTHSIGTNAWIGDANVQTVMSAVSGSAQTARNASFIEFDFVPFQNSFSFDFLFASNEYGQYQCDFSDTFIFLLTNLDSGVTTNIAVIPSTTTPISVVSIRNNAFNNGCNSVNPSFFGNYYLSNPTTAPINFRGATVPMTAIGTVIPGNNYRIKLAVADRLDTLLDSAVFIKGSSFSLGDIALGDDLFIETNTALCHGETVLVETGLSETIFDFEWFLDGEPIVGHNQSSYLVSEWGTYSVNARIKGNPNCMVSDDINIEIFPEIRPIAPLNIRQCNFGNPFDLTVNTPRLLQLYPAPIYEVSYFTSLSDAQNNINPIANPANFTETSNPQTIFGRVFNIERECYGIRSFQVRRPKTWNGSVNTHWDNPSNWTPFGVPTAEDCVIVHATSNDPIISGDGYIGYGYNIEVRDNATLTIRENTQLKIIDEVIVRPSGLMEFLNNASLVQVHDIENMGNITYRRNAFIRRLDYVYWSSPVKDFHIHNVSPGTPASRIYAWNTTIANSNNSFGNWQVANENMALGKGYIVRGPNSFNDTPQWHTTTFVGLPNNGDINFPISRGNHTGSPYFGTNGVEITNMDDNFNLIGNPYPSAISYEEFITANPDLEGSIRVWSHGTPISTSNGNPFYGSFGYNYSSSDYIIHNMLGTISGPQTYDGFIPAGQGFFVLMNDGPAATSNVVFRNNMRVDNSNAQFFRMPNMSVINPENHVNKLWIDLVAPNGSASRTLVGYHPHATNDKDRLFDSYLKLENSNTIYTLIDNDRCSIQGRAPFVASDVVPVGFRATSAATFQIAIGFAEGIFNNSQTVYLEDHYLNVIHNLSNSPYNFSSSIGTFEDRFELKYTNETLSVSDNITNEIKIITNDYITFYSGNEIINNLKIYDVQGRLLYQANQVSASEKTIYDFIKLNQTLIISLEFESGLKASKKILF